MPASRKRFNNTDRRGRRKVESFVQLKRFMLNHPSWRALSPKARCVYIELRNRFRGDNNGEIFLSHREAAEVAHASKSTAGRLFKELIEHGYIKPAIKGRFRNRWASTWILTNERLGDAPPTHEWAKWKAP